MDQPLVPGRQAAEQDRDPFTFRTRERPLRGAAEVRDGRDTSPASASRRWRSSSTFNMTMSRIRSPR